MQAFTLLWIFDRRWLFKIKNPLWQFLLVVPTLINIATITLMVLQKQSNRIETQSFFILLVTFYGVAALITIYFIFSIYLAAQARLKNVQQNVDEIRAFSHNFQIKKVFWSLKTLFLVLITIASLVINNHYIFLYEKIYRLQTLTTRFYIDIGFWCYIALTFCAFILFKLMYLLFAWKMPEKYLRFKSII